MFSRLSLIGLLSATVYAAAPVAPGPYVGVYNVTDTTARISFLDNATNEEGFKVYIHDAKDVLDATVVPNPVVVGAHDGADPYQYADIAGLNPQSLYKLHISAFNADGESAKTIPSSENNGRIKTSPMECQPAMPGEYVGTYNTTNTSARISFLDNSTNEDGFKVYVYDYDTDALVKTIAAEPKAGTGSYQYANIIGLTPNTLYRVAVTAYSSECGESKPTHASSATNGRFRTTNETCPVMPGEYVGVYHVTSSSARLSFLDNSANETGFHVYVYDRSKTLVKTLTLPSVSDLGHYQYANITGLTANSFFSVKISAFNRSCESTKTTPSSKTNGRFVTLP